MGRTTSLTWGALTRLFEQWSERYIAAGPYLAIDGRPVCAFLNLTDFVKCYGQATFAVMLRHAGNVVERKVGVRPFMMGIIGETNIMNARLANALPLDGITGYGLLPNWLGEPIQSYGMLMRERIADWDNLQRHIRIPFYPVACVGWDASLRGEYREELRSEYGYPYSPVVVGATPALFGEFLDAALAFNERWGPRENVVFLHAWNEWSEGSAIEASNRHGYAYLDEIRKRADRFRPITLPNADVIRPI